MTRARRCIQTLVPLFALALLGASCSTGGPEEAAATDVSVDEGSEAGEAKVQEISDVQNYYDGERVTFLLNYSAGGSTDLWARLTTSHLVEHIPGEPGQTIEYHPGAAGAIGVQYYQENAEPDGYTIGVIGGSLPGRKAVEPELEDLDISSGQAILGMAEGHVVYGSPEVFPDGYESLTAPSADEVFVGASNTQRWAMGHAWWTLLGMRDSTEVIVGYDGQAEQLQAMLSGEIHAAVTPAGGYNELIRPQVDEGALVPLFQDGVLTEDGETARAPGLENIPTFEEVVGELTGGGYEGDEGELLKFFIEADINRWLSVPDETPSEIVEALRVAAQEMIQNPEFLEEQAEIYGTDDPSFHRPGERIDTAIQNILDNSAGAKDIMDEWIEEYNPGG